MELRDGDLLLRPWAEDDVPAMLAGCWIARDERGRGICTRALRLLARHGLDELGLQRVDLITDPDNVASQRVAEKVGFQREGVLRAHLRHPDGRVRDSVMFSLLPGELRE
jgi:RimJ/RimL family protein N-acetyltransferase